MGRTDGRWIVPFAGERIDDFNLPLLDVYKAVRLSPGCAMIVPLGYVTTLTAARNASTCAGDSGVRIIWRRSSPIVSKEAPKGYRFTNGTRFCEKWSPLIDQRPMAGPYSMGFAAAERSAVGAQAISNSAGCCRCAPCSAFRGHVAGIGQPPVHFRSSPPIARARYAFRSVLNPE